LVARITQWQVLQALSDAGVPLNIGADPAGSQNALRVNLWDNLGQALVTRTTVPFVTDRGVVVRVVGAVALLGGARVTSDQGTPAASGSGWPVFTDKLDGLSNAVTQTAVGVAAVQLITAGTLYKELRIKNSSVTQTVFIGFDNTVSTTTGYRLEKLGVDDEIVLYGQNSNVWAIASAAGGSVDILGRG
jgi:hypothetical protein